jgi:hypothetical protein
MAMTLRLREGFAERGRRYVAEMGISLNALVAVTLREYLDVRKPEPRTAAPPRAQALAQAIARRVKAGPVRRRR